MLIALLFAGLAEALGLSAFLPLLNLAIYKDTATSEDSIPRSELEQAVNQFLGSIGIEPSIGVMLAVIVAAVLLKSILLLLAERKVGYIAAQLATDLRLDLLKAILLSRWEYFLHQPVGKLTNALATEAQRASQSFIFGATAVTFLIQALVYAAVALSVSWKATAIGLVAGILVIAPGYFLVRMARKAGKKQTRLTTSLMSRMTDTLQSVKSLKGMGREHLADSVLEMETALINQALRKQVMSSALLNSVQELSFAIVIAAGMFIALVKFGMPLATVTLLIVVLGRMLSQLGKVQKQYQKMSLGESAYWSIRETIAAAKREREELGKGQTPSIRDNIRFRAVHFAYDKRDVLKGIDLEIPAGELTTLIGASGTGKTTIIDLIIGLLNTDRGEVMIDGVNIAQLDIKTWRRMIGYVPQETLLLHDTIEHNVSLGDKALGADDVKRALHDAGAWDFVQALPEGTQHMVGERGGKLSGGQRQRIMIARALVQRPQLLILDEATSALDPASEQAICQTLTSLRGKLTLLAISHQSALVSAADRVYLLEDGRARAQSDTKSSNAGSR